MHNFIFEVIFDVLPAARNSSLNVNVIIGMHGELCVWLSTHEPFSDRVTTRSSHENSDLLGFGWWLSAQLNKYGAGEEWHSFTAECFPVSLESQNFNYSISFQLLFLSLLGWDLIHSHSIYYFILFLLILSSFFPSHQLLYSFFYFYLTLDLCECNYNTNHTFS